MTSYWYLLAAAAVVEKKSPIGARDGRRERGEPHGAEHVRTPSSAPLDEPQITGDCLYDTPSLRPTPSLRCQLDASSQVIITAFNGYDRTQEDYASVGTTSRTFAFLARHSVIGYYSPLELSSTDYRNVRR
uniref:Uncharacterized protein n=1 Tax=Plectus sambesii TaxID=2011161 RepID=A0A914X6M9_9BILA